MVNESLSGSGNERYYYRDSELVPYKSNGRLYSPIDLKFIHERYEALLEDHSFSEVREIERRANYPKGFLNFVLFTLANQNGNGLSILLQQEFPDRVAIKGEYLNRFKNNR